MAVDQKEQKRQGVRKGIKICLIVFFIAFIVAVAGSLFYLKWIINTPVSNDSGKKYFEVKQNEPSLTIAQDLFEKDLIKSETIFYLYAKIKGKAFLPGIYEIPKNAKMVEVFDKISKGETKIVKFTIPEGYRTEQIGQLLEEKKLGSYEDFVPLAKKYEGQLFPDTYYISSEYTSDQIIETMHNNYLDKISGLKVTDEDLIIASIVEREAIKDEERSIIAGVYKNRIERKMKLEADPTVQYAKDNQNTQYLSLSDKLNFQYWQKITGADYLKTKSDYNTYIIPALPSGPICNPGIASIKATLNYTHHNYLYFLQADGQIYPSETVAEHEQNKKKYLN